MGFGVDVLTFPLGQSPDIRQVRYFRVGNHFRFRRIPIGFSLRKVWLDLLLWRELRRMLDTGEYVCVHAVEEAAFFAALAARRRGLPVVYDMQSSIAEQLSEHWLFGLAPLRHFVEHAEGWLLRNVARVACSAGLEDRVRRHAPDANVLRWIFPGTYEPGAESQRSGVRAALGVEEDQPVIIYTGNFVDYQGVPDLAAAVSLVSEAHPRVVFVFVGASMDEAGAVGQCLKGTAPASSYRLIPRQPASEIPGYLAAADIAVSPRKYGSNLPLKVIEYLAAGLPMVATDIIAHSTLLDSETALLVDPTTAGLADGLKELLENTERRDSYRAAARAYASQHLGTAAFLLSVAQLYDNLEGVGLPF